MTQLNSEIICYNARGIADEKKRKRFSITLKRNLPQRLLFLFYYYVLDSYYYSGHWGYIYIYLYKGINQAVCVGNALHSVYELQFTFVNSGIFILST